MLLNYNGYKINVCLICLHVSILIVNPKEYDQNTLLDTFGSNTAPLAHEIMPKIEPATLLCVWYFTAPPLFIVSELFWPPANLTQLVFVSSLSCVCPQKSQSWYNVSPHFFLSHCLCVWLGVCVYQREGCEVGGAKCYCLFDYRLRLDGCLVHYV